MENGGKGSGAVVFAADLGAFVSWVVIEAELVEDAELLLGESAYAKRGGLLSIWISVARI